MTFSGSNAGVWDGLSKGDPGHWGLEGMNGPSFLGLNQVSGWNETVTFARPVNFVSLDFSHAIGAGSSVTMELEAFHNGFVIGLTSAILGTANSWTTLSLSSSNCSAI